MAEKMVAVRNDRKRNYAGCAYQQIKQVPEHRVADYVRM